MRWGNFFQRKAAPMAPIALVTPEEVAHQDDPLKELQNIIVMRQSCLTALEAESAQLGTALGESLALASTLKVRISENDGSAVEQLDELERQQRSITRRREGLTLRILSLRAEIEPLVRQASALASERDADRQDASVQAIRRDVDRLLQTTLDRWQQACAAAFDLMTVLDAKGESLDEEHRRMLLTMKSDIGGKLQAAALAPTNFGHEYVVNYSEVFRQLVIVPCKRREATQRAG